MEATDYAAASRRAVRSDLIKFGKWFVAANREAFDLSRITTRDCADFRDSLRRERNQSVATVNRNLVSLRRFFGWLKDKGHVQSSPVEGVKELRRQESVPKSLDRAAIRKLLRIRAAQQISTCPSPCACALLERRLGKREPNRSAKRSRASESPTS
ncbi:MAG: hypothetical protein DYG92_04160 [Leptolyngbya sp. PLA1]|nr:hypothetical protein [Leptolyngbya sp. PLA1]